MESHVKPTSKTLFGKRAIIYLRTAIAKEKEISRQEEAFKKLIDQHNSTIITTIQEDGISGNADISMRPGLAQALEMCESKMAEVLVTHRLNRLSRNINELLRLFDRLQRADVSVVTVIEGDIFAQPRYLALQEMYTAIVHLKRERTIEHASQGQKRRNKQKRPEHPSMENLRFFEE
jgi:DNA invertase Pin-like site-specific DNA recombinase